MKRVQSAFPDYAFRRIITVYYSTMMSDSSFDTLMDRRAA